MKLFMILLGALPPGRNTEQHDVFFGIAENLQSLKEDMFAFWPEAGNSLHIDVAREVNFVDGYKVEIAAISESARSEMKLFFLNLGGYRENEFEEYHYKMLMVAIDKGAAVSMAKKTAFFKHYDLKPGANSHIDEKYGIDVDDLYPIEDILPEKYKSIYRVIVTPCTEHEQDAIAPGYLKLAKL